MTAALGQLRRWNGTYYSRNAALVQQISHDDSWLALRIGRVFRECGIETQAYSVSLGVAMLNSRFPMKPL